MKPIVQVSEDGQQMEMIIEDGTLYIYDRITESDLQYIATLMEKGGDVDE